jgi:hypothetical protein
MLIPLDLPSDRVSDRIAAAGEGRVCTLSRRELRLATDDCLVL